MLVFGFYMLVVVGFGFMTIPHQILHIFGLSAGDNVWIRMMGMLGSIIGFYYIKFLLHKGGTQRIGHFHLLGPGLHFVPTRKIRAVRH